MSTTFEKFLVISKDSTYKIISIESKKFIDTNVIYINKFDPKKIFSVIYTDRDSNFSYAKKFKIEKFITNKVYNIGTTNNGIINYISLDPKDKVNVYYKKKPKQKINEIVYDFSTLEIKGVSARGNRVSSKIVNKVTKKRVD